MKSYTHYDFTWYHWTKFWGAWYQVAVTAIYLDLLYLYVTFKEHGSIVFFYLSKLPSLTCSHFFTPVKCDTSSFTVVSYACYKINGISVTWYQVTWCSRGPPKLIIITLPVWTKSWQPCCYNCNIYEITNTWDRPFWKLTRSLGCLWNFSKKERNIIIEYSPIGCPYLVDSWLLVSSLWLA